MPEQAQRVKHEEAIVGGAVAAHEVHTGPDVHVGGIVACTREIAEKLYRRPRPCVGVEAAAIARCRRCVGNLAAIDAKLWRETEREREREREKKKKKKKKKKKRMKRP